MSLRLAEAPENLALDTDIEAWASAMKGRLGFSPVHVRHCTVYVRGAVDWCKWRQPADLCAGDAEHWLDHKMASGWSRKTAQNGLAALREFSGFLKTRRKIADLPFAEVKIGKGKKGRGAVGFSPAETDAIIAAAESREEGGRRSRRFGRLASTFYRVLARTGLRYGEAKSQNRADIDLPRCRFQITLDKERRGDWLPLSPEMVGVLRKWMGANTQKGLLFPSVPNHHTLAKDMKTARIASQKDGRSGQWHRFRKGLNTALVLQGENVGTIGKILRHRKPELTMDNYLTSELLPMAEALSRLPALSKMATKCVDRPGGISEDMDAEDRPSMPTPKTIPVKSAKKPAVERRGRRPQQTLANARRSASLRSSGGGLNGAGGNCPPGRDAGSLADLIVAALRGAADALDRGRQ